MRTGALQQGIAAGYRHALERDTRSAGASTPTDSIRPPSSRACSRVVGEGSCDAAIGSRFVSGDGYAAYRYAPSGARRFGTAVLRRAMKLALGRPFGDATSGMTAANAAALPYLSEPYTTGAPEVQALLRLHGGGLRVDEVPVDMRDRGAGVEAAAAEEGAPARAVTAVAGRSLRSRSCADAVDETTPPRLIVVLGYSDGRDGASRTPIQPPARLEAAARLATRDDVVVAVRPGSSAPRRGPRRS